MANAITRNHTERHRNQMVEQQLQGRGIHEQRILQAFMNVPREAFLPAAQQPRAYEDCPLPIDAGQTISQPYVVALTAEALRLKGWERVLEVGTGSGYAAAVLAHLAARVFTIERHAHLADQAERNLAAVGVDNVRVTCGDGSLGWPEHAPYDAIAVAASAPAVPRALLEQLTVGGRLVIPVGHGNDEYLVRVTRTSVTDFSRERLCPVRFVPLIGLQGWAN
jgi:protein-L-isoaspartate(D-aspartate) O-methyltransferase